MIAMKWMVDKCELHGLELDPLAKAQFTSVVPQWTLDPVDVPWPGYKLMPPRLRRVSEDACLAHTVPLRISGLPTYLPANLTVDGERGLASTYSIVSI